MRVARPTGLDPNAGWIVPDDSRGVWLRSMPPDSSSELSWHVPGDDVENSKSTSSQGCIRPARPTSHKENTMAKYLLLKHYRGAPAPANDVPMDRWQPDEVEAHIRFMNDFAARLESS